MKSVFQLLILLFFTNILFSQNDTTSIFIGTWKIKRIKSEGYNPKIGKCIVTRNPDGTLIWEMYFKTIDGIKMHQKDLGTWWIKGNKYFQKIDNNLVDYEYLVINKNKIYFQLRSDIIEKDEIILRENQVRINK